MRIAWHGHSVVSVLTKAGQTILIDPFLTGNDLCDLDSETVAADYILLTHAHEDHYGDTEAIAKRTGAKVIANVEIAAYLEKKGLNTHGMQMGGQHLFNFGKVKMTPAIHGSSIEINGLPFTLGLAAGFLLTIDGKTIYHAGDTALFTDMKLIGENGPIDLAFLPIGDNFTMGPEDALRAAEYLQAVCVVPIHYNTFPVIQQDPKDFCRNLAGSKGIVPKIGQWIQI